MAFEPSWPESWQVISTVKEDLAAELPCSETTLVTFDVWSNRKEDMNEIIHPILHAYFHYIHLFELSYDYLNNTSLHKFCHIAYYVKIDWGQCG